MPPQADGKSATDQLGDEIMELVLGETLSKDISNICRRRNVMELNGLVCKRLTDEVKVDIDMLGAVVQNWIGGQCNGTDIVTVE